MPRQNIISESTPHHIDFGSNLHNFIMSDDDMSHDRVPGAWLSHYSDFGEEGDEEFSDANMTRSKAKSIADSALADLQRATSEADTERLRRQALRERYAADEWRLLANVTPKGSQTLASRSLKSLQREVYEEEMEKLRGEASRELHAAEEKKLGPAFAKGQKKPASSDTLSHAVAAQNNVVGVSTNKVRRPLMKPSLNLGGPPISCGTAVPAQSNASGVASDKPRPSLVHPPPDSARQNAGGAHCSELLPLMDEFNARGGAHTAATRTIIDGGLISENQVAAARPRVRPDAQALTGERTHEDRLAALRAKLAAEGRVVATVSQQASDSGVKTTKVASQAPVRPESPQVPATLGASKHPTQLKAKILFSAGTAQPGLSTADGVKQPVGNTSALRQLLANESKPEIEAGRRCAGHPVSRTLPIYGLGQVPRYSSAKPAASAASTTTTTPSQSISERVQAIVRRYGTAKNARDDASAAAFVAHKLKENMNRLDFDAGKTPSTTTQLKMPTTTKVKSTHGLATKSDVAKAADVDDGFDVLTSKGPSAANGRPLPDPDLITNQLDVDFSPTLKGFQGWEDDYDSDDSEDWDLGGLAEWKWVGEKSAEESSPAKRQV
jgi:hypothetical protein